MDIFEIYLDFKSIKKVNSTVTGVISLKINGVFFPEKEWNDFIIVLIKNWLDSSYSLLYEKSDYEEFFFIDGPYFFRTKKRDPLSCYLECIGSYNNNILLSGILNINSLHDQIFRCAYNLQQFFMKNNWMTDDIEEFYSKIRKMTP